MTQKSRLLLQAAFFGIAFGFLLQKAGVAKYQVLEGQLLLTDFTVMRVILTAIVVAMLGLFSLKKMGKIHFHLKPTKIASNIIGGLIFGIGFACAGYCPGTGAAGLGQGDLPVLIVIAGLVVGSYLFAEGSRFLSRTIDTIGSEGNLTFDKVSNLGVVSSVSLFTVAIGIVLFLINKVV